MNCQRSKKSPEDGFTIIEAMISLIFISVLVVFMFSIVTEVTIFSGNAEANYTSQTEVHRSFSRLAELLRKTGWNETGGITYPRVLAGGNELEFRILTDLDGNGYAFDATTGGVEWDARIFRVRRDFEGSLQVFSGANKVWSLGRHIKTVSFTTVNEDSNLQFKEIQVVLEAEKEDRTGEVVSFTSRGSIHMRN